MFSELTRNALVYYALLYPHAQPSAPITCTPHNTVLLHPIRPPKLWRCELGQHLPRPPH